MTQPISPPRYFALIPAAGVGSRMHSATPKQYLPLLDQPVIAHTVSAFLAMPQIAQVVVVVSRDDAYADEFIPHDTRVALLRCGGETRHASVLNGLQARADQWADNDWVLVHDAARPGLGVVMIEKLIAAVDDHPIGGLLAMPVVDTVKRFASGKVQTVEREGLWLAQTPQMFRYGLLRHALETVAQVTDESSAIEALGHTPLLVPGAAANLKITVPDDLSLVRMHLMQER